MPRFAVATIKDPLTGQETLARPGDDGRAAWVEDTPGNRAGFDLHWKRQKGVTIKTVSAKGLEKLVYNRRKRHKPIQGGLFE